MSEPFLGEIKVISWNFPPKGWAFCNGQLLPINQNQALFSILGTYYGGDGRTTFGLPNLQGSVAVHVGNGVVLGERGGEPTHTLNIAELPAHNHQLQDYNQAAAAPVPGNNVFATAQNNVVMYAGNSDGNTLNPGSLTPVGGNQPHENMQPYLVLNFIIALQGIYPSPN